jgi:hypothetical protein
VKYFFWIALLLHLGCANPQGSSSTIDFNFHPGIPTSSSAAANYAIPVIITNNQASPTPLNFEQMVTINSNSNIGLYAANLQNVNWQDGSGHILNSWLESGETSNSTASVYWINLGTNTIAAAGGTFTIYEVIYPVNNNIFDGLTTGAEPNFTLTYGQYDNGVNVFTQYGGKSWANFTTIGGTWDTTHGYLEQTSTAGNYSGGPCALIETTSYAANSNFTLETAFSYTSQAIARVGLSAVMTPVVGDASGYRFVGQQSNNGAGFLSFLNDQIVWVTNNNYLGTLGASYTMQIQDNGVTFSGSLYSGYGVTGTVVTSLGNISYVAPNNSGATQGFVGVAAGDFNGANVVANPAKFQWFRLRNLPPATVMPVTSVQSVINF